MPRRGHVAKAGPLQGTGSASHCRAASSSRPTERLSLGQGRPKGEGDRRSAKTGGFFIPGM